MSSVVEYFESDVAVAIKAGTADLPKILEALRRAQPELKVQDYRGKGPLPSVLVDTAPTVVLLGAEQADLGRVVQRTEAQASGARVFTHWIAIVPPGFVVPDTLQWVHAEHLQETVA